MARLTKQCECFCLLDNSHLKKFDRRLFGRERGGEINYQGGEINYHVTRSFTESLIGEKCSLDINWEDNYVVSMIKSCVVSMIKSWGSAWA